MDVYNISFDGLEREVNEAMPLAGGTFTGAVTAAAPGANTFSTPQLINAIVLAAGSSPRTDLPAGTLQFILK